MSNRFKDKIYSEADVVTNAQSLSRAQVLNQQRPEVKHAAVRLTCTHKMGGRNLGGLKAGLGDYDEYCVSKFKLPSGDIRVRCSRCRKVWLPPLRIEFPREVDYDYAMIQYKKALNFPTDLAMFAAPQVRVISEDRRTYKKPSYRAWCPND